MALLQKETCNSRHLMHRRHPVLVDTLTLFHNFFTSSLLYFCIIFNIPPHKSPSRLDTNTIHTTSMCLYSLTFYFLLLKSIRFFFRHLHRTTCRHSNNMPLVRAQLLYVFVYSLLSFFTVKFFCFSPVLT